MEVIIKDLKLIDIIKSNAAECGTYLEISDVEISVKEYSYELEVLLNTIAKLWYHSRVVTEPHFEGKLLHHFLKDRG